MSILRILLITYGLLHIAAGSLFAGTQDLRPLRDGDVIFHTSRSSQSLAIQRATGSRYSHMGIIFIKNGSPMVYEAVQTVRYTPLAKWTRRGEGGHYVIKRLVNAEQTLNAEALRKDCQGLWVEVEVEKEKNFNSKMDIETFGLDEFVKLCKARVLKYAGVQTNQSIRLGYWMEWNEPESLNWLAEKLLEDPLQEISFTDQTVKRL